MEDIDRLAKIIWDYHLVGHQLKHSDCIFVLGSHDTRVAEYAADLYLKGYAPFILFSGNRGAFTKDVFEEPEARIFAKIAIAKGVPSLNIIIEDKATNTGENITNSKRLIEEKGMNINSFILVQKPYMERRTLATFEKQWPGKEFIVTSPQGSFEDYITDEYPKDKLINNMVGDLQRIIEYPKKGYQTEQAVPAEVLDAYHQLIKLGYTNRLIKD